MLALWLHQYLYGLCLDLIQYLDFFLIDKRLFREGEEWRLFKFYGFDILRMAVCVLGLLYFYTNVSIEPGTRALVTMSTSHLLYINAIQETSRWSGPIGL